MVSPPNVTGEHAYLKFLSLNVRSLRYKTSLILANIHDRTDVISIQESHLDDTISDDVISIDGYSHVRLDRSSHGGGVVIYISDRLGWEHQHFNLSRQNNIEYLCIDVIIGYRRFRICNVYRPDSPVSWYDHFTELLDHVCNVTYDLYIMGDFNIDFSNDQAHAF